MDPDRSARLQNVQIKRDRLNITLIDGVIQFAKEVNGVVLGAVFHGKGRVLVDPPNPIEAQQLRLFTKQDKLDMTFTAATFSFTDGLLDEVARQVKWQTSGSSSDDLYAKRQQEREDLGRSTSRGFSKACCPVTGSELHFFSQISRRRIRIERFSINDEEDTLAEVHQ